MPVACWSQVAAENTRPFTRTHTHAHPHQPNTKTQTEIKTDRDCENARKRYTRPAWETAVKIRDQGRIQDKMARHLATFLRAMPLPVHYVLQTSSLTAHSQESPNSVGRVMINSTRGKLEGQSRLVTTGFN